MAMADHMTLLLLLGRREVREDWPPTQIHTMTNFRGEANKCVQYWEDEKPCISQPLLT